MLATGEVSWARAQQVVRRTGAVPAEVMSEVVDRLTTPYPECSACGLGGLLVPQAIFTTRLRRLAARYAMADDRHEVAIEQRMVIADIDTDDGTGRFEVTGHGGRVVGAFERVDGIARRLRGEGDCRTLKQLRSDVALDLLLYGDLPPVPPEALPGVDGDRFAAYAVFGGALPPAQVDVVVSLASLMGATDEPGMLAHGNTEEYVSAAIVRDLAFGAGSTWRRLVTDPVTGHMTDLQTDRYEITGYLRERVIARDRISRAPGSATPARRCDMDHDLDWHSGGASSESNVSAKHRRGHNHKTRGTWVSSREPGVHGVIYWTTPTGRVYQTLPWDYRDPEPVTVVDMQARLAGRADQEHRPPQPEGVPDGAQEIVSGVEKVPFTSWKTT